MTGAEEHTGFFSHAINWVSISIILFGFVLYKYARRPFFDMLDSRTDKIKNELEEAERLRIEAQELLAKYQRKHTDAVKEAEQIIADAQKQALEMKTVAEKELKQEMARKERLFSERIKRMEHDAVQQVRDKIIDISIKTSEELLQQNILKNQETAKKITDTSLEIVAKNIHKAA